MSAGLTAADALAMLRKIDGSLDAFCDTAPLTVEAMGGRAWLREVSEVTCVGPVPRIDAALWERMSLEHVGRNSRYGNEHSGRGVPEGPRSRTDGIPPTPSVRGGGSRSFSR